MTVPDLLLEVKSAVAPAAVLSSVRDRVDDADLGDLEALVSSATDSLVDPAREFEDEDALYAWLTELWLGLKYDWAEGEQELQERLDAGEQPDSEARVASLVASTVLEALEELLRPSDILRMIEEAPVALETDCDGF